MLFSEQTWPELAALSGTYLLLSPSRPLNSMVITCRLATDTILLTEVVSRVNAQLTDSILVTPVQWFGNSDHHLDFGGTHFQRRHESI